MIYQQLTIRACARYAAVICPIVTLISGLVFFSRLLGDAAAGVVPAYTLWQLFLLTLLKYAPQLLILSVFTGTFVAMRRAYAQHEMDAWFSSGLGARDFIKPVLMFALPAMLFVGVLSLYVSPWSVYNINVIRASTAFDIKIDSLPREQFNITPGKNYSYFIKSDDSIFAAHNGRHQIIVASGLHREDTTSLRLIDGNLFNLSAADGHILEKMHFGSIRLALPSADSFAVRPRTKNVAALDWDNHAERAELIWRLALPLAVIVLALLALFLSPTHSRFARNYGFLLTMAMFFLYLQGLRFMREQVEDDALPAALALLAPPLITGLIALGLWRLYRFR